MVAYAGRMTEQLVVMRSDLLPERERESGRLTCLSSVGVAFLTVVERPYDAIAELNDWDTNHTRYPFLQSGSAEEVDDYPAASSAHYALRQLFARGVDEAIGLPDGTNRVLAADQTLQDLLAEQLTADEKDLDAADMRRRVRRLLVILEHAFPPPHNGGTEAA